MPKNFKTSLGLLDGKSHCSYLDVLLLSDLECDNLNPQEYFIRLNSYVTPRLGAQVLLITSLFISGHWWLSFSNVPLVFWFVFDCVSQHQQGPCGYFGGDGRILHRYRHRKILLPKTNVGVCDLFEIYNRNGVQKHLMKSLLNICWLLVSLSFNMYFTMQALLSDDELQELPFKWNNTEY